eukprot:IDg5249t1
MPRGRGWTSTECKDLAESWAKASNNSVLGADQSSAAYRAGVYKYFQGCNVLYKDRDKSRVMRKLADMCKDVQKFNGIAVALHLGKFVPGSDDSILSTMYNFKDFDVSAWVFVEGCKVLQMYPKFKPGTSVTLEAPADDTKGGSGSSGGGGAPSGANTSRNSVGGAGDGTDGGSTSETSPTRGNPRNKSRGGHAGRKAGKAASLVAIRQEQAVRCMSAISDSMKRKSVALEEANALQAFRVTLGVETQEDVAMKDEFLRAVRRKYLSSVLRAASVSRQPPGSSVASPSLQNADVVTPEVLRRQDEEAATEEAGAGQEEESGDRSA